MLTMQTDNFFGINKTKEVKCLQTLKKKLSNVYFLFRFLWKSLPTATAAQHLLFLSKRSHKKLVWEQMGSCFFLFVSSFAKKKGLKRQIVLFFFCWTKTLWGLNQEQESKCFEEVEIVFAFLLQATKKTFTVLPLAS